MWEKLDLVRVYTKPRGQLPDYTAPVVLRRSRCSVEDFCNAIHKEIFKQMKVSLHMIPVRIPRLVFLTEIAADFLVFDSVGHKCQ
jgi:hypothetical protein